MNLQDETYNILGQRLLGEFDSKKMVEWAVNAINLGFDSDSLIVLAGLDFESTEKREYYFWISVTELGLNIKREEPESINDYAKYVANAVLNNQLSAKSGLEKMRVICSSTEYDSKYIQFYRIDEDVDYLTYDDKSPPIYNPGITLENVEEYIKREFKNFLECEELGIDREMLEKAICNDCGGITKPELKTRFQIRKLSSKREFVCKDCKSHKIDFFRSRIGKEKILKKIKTTRDNN